MRKLIIATLTILTVVLSTTFATLSPAQASSGCSVRVDWIYIDNSVRATPSFKCNSWRHQVTLRTSMHVNGQWKSNLDKEKTWWSVGTKRHFGPWTQHINEMGSNTYCLRYWLSTWLPNGTVDELSGRSCFVE